MKKFLLIVIGLSFLTTVNAQKTVSQEMAVKVAVQCLISKTTNKSLIIAEDYIKNIETIKKFQTDVFYVVNFNPTGFVIVSASETYHPVIAFSFDGNFDLPITAPAVNMWLDNEATKLIYSVYKKSNYPQIEEEWYLYKHSNILFLSLRNDKVLLPMLTTQWNQGIYYNEMCPCDPQGPDGKTYAGCVATAIGQVMNYFRYPLTGTGSYTSEYTVYGTHTMNYENAEYHWNEMPLKLTRSNHPLSTLLYHIGVSVDMNYGPDGSGMWNHKAAHTMKTFFGYTDSTQYNFRDTTSIDWNGMLIDHLDRGIVLYYAGWTDSQYVSGHAFVCDGYQDSTFFHFNWGWGGSWDGYFHIDNLIVGGADFTTMHEAVMNATPESNYPYYCNGTDTLRTIDGTIEDGSGPIYEYLNNANCSWLIMPHDTITSIAIEFVKCDLQPGDVIRIYRGSHSGAPLIGSYTGNGPTGIIDVTGNTAFVVFESDGNSTSSGFLLSYKCNQVKTCNGLSTLTTASGTITDGSGPFNYQNTNNCRWRIEPPGAEFISISFSEFDIDSTDYVKITDLNSNQVIANLKGNQIPDSIHAWTSKILVQFLSTSTGNAGGFTLHYKSSLQHVEDLMQTQISIFPNPAFDYITINISESSNPQELNVKVFSLSGTLMKNEQIPKGTKKHTVQLSELPVGLYIVSIANEMGYSVNKKVSIIR